MLVHYLALTLVPFQKLVAQAPVALICGTTINGMLSEEDRIDRKATYSNRMLALTEQLEDKRGLFAMLCNNILTPLHSLLCCMQC